MNYTEIICSIIAFSGIVLSGFVSWFTARYAAKKETEKMLLSWKHESEISFEKEFSEMIAAANEFIQHRSPKRKRDACSRILVLCSKSPASLLPSLQKLYQLFQNHPPETSPLISALSEIIETENKNRTRR